MKSIASTPRTSRKSRNEATQGLTVGRLVMRPLSVVAALLALTMVVLPTAGTAVAGKYNNNDGGGDDNTIEKVALISAVVGAILYFSSDRDDDDDNNNTQ